MSGDLGEQGLTGRCREVDLLASAVARLGRGSPVVVDLVGEPGVGKTRLLAELARLLGDRPVLRARATESDGPGGVLHRAGTAPGASGGAFEWVAAGVEPDASGGVPYRECGAEPASGGTPHEPLGAEPEASGGVPHRECGTGPASGGAFERAAAGVEPEASGGVPHRECGTELASGGAFEWAAAGVEPEASGAVPYRECGAGPASGGGFEWAAAGVEPEASGAVPYRECGTEPASGGAFERAAAGVEPEASGWVPHRECGTQPASGGGLRGALGTSGGGSHQAVGVETAGSAGPLGIRPEAFRASLLHLATCAGSAALLLDDLHLADPDSLAALEQLLTTLPDTALLVAVSYRPRQAPPRLLAALAAPEVATRRTRIELAPLTDTTPVTSPTGRRPDDLTHTDHPDHPDDSRRGLVAALRRSTSDSTAECALDMSIVDLIAGTVSRRTLELARTALAAPGPARVAAHAVAAVVNHLLGDLDTAITCRDDAAAGLDALTDTELAGRLDACLWTGWAENALSRYLPALTHFDRGIELARHPGHAHLLCPLFTGRAIGRRRLGHLPAARRDADEAVTVADRLGSDELRALARCTRAWIALLGDDIAAARAEADTVVRLLDRLACPWATQAGFVAALAQAEDGQPGPAGQRLLALGGGADLPLVDPASRPGWYELLTRSAMAGGDRARAAGWSARAAAAADDRLPLGAGLAALARAESLRPTDPAAAGHVRRAIELFSAAGTPVEQARATTVLAGCLAATGQTTGARKLARRAADRYDACGATRLAALARAPFGDAAGRPALSPREHEVAVLVSHGCTNRQISETLHVTEKTVETYLSRIFTKLDLTSRAALAAWAVAVS